MSDPTQIDNHKKYIEKHLLPEIKGKLPGNLKDYSIEHMKQFDGFMSSLYQTVLKMEDVGTKTEQTHSMLIKFMKGGKKFRDSVNANVLFANEILIYSKVLPYYEKIIAESGLTSINVKDWVPHAYVAKFGHFDELSNDSSPESILVLENLQPKGYRMGPKLYLDRNHMLCMTKPLAEYHSLTYVLRILKDNKLQEFSKDIIHLPFNVSEKDRGKKDNNNFFDVLYNVAFERFFSFFDRIKMTLLRDDNDEDVKLMENLKRLREKYGKNPTDLLERFQTIYDEDDEKFAAILHGDFCRNNVLFKYDKENVENNEFSTDIPKDVKMIDFQELRYGTPAIDLSFYMYMNMDPSIRDEFWMELLKYYHGTMYKALADIVMATTDDTAIHESLNQYSFDKFYRHFSKSAFYGAMVCMHFLPWVTGPKEECEKIGHLFETDMHGEEFHRFSLEVGGHDADLRILEIVRHANRMSYMDDL